MNLFCSVVYYSCFSFSSKRKGQAELDCAAVFLGPASVFGAVWAATQVAIPGLWTFAPWITVDQLEVSINYGSANYGFGSYDNRLTPAFNLGSSFEASFLSVTEG